MWEQSRWAHPWPYKPAHDVPVPWARVTQGSFYPCNAQDTHTATKDTECTGQKSCLLHQEPSQNCCEGAASASTDSYRALAELTLTQDPAALRVLQSGIRCAASKLVPLLTRAANDRKHLQVKALTGSRSGFSSLKNSSYVQSLKHQSQQIDDFFLIFFFYHLSQESNYEGKHYFSFLRGTSLSVCVSDLLNKMFCSKSHGNVNSANARGNDRRIQMTIRKVCPDAWGMSNDKVLVKFHLPGLGQRLWPWKKKIRCAN